MAGFIVRDSIPKKALIPAFCLSVFLCMQTAAAFAQRVPHVGGHPTAAPRMSVPVPRPAIPHPAAAVGRPRVLPSARLLAGAQSARTFRVPFSPRFGRPLFGSRRAFFVDVPFFLFAGFNRTTPWFGCGAFYEFNLNCNSLAFYGTGTGFENYVNVPLYVNPPYEYLAQTHDEIWLYLKDGTVYSVIDYWFVNGQVHFTAVEEPGMPPVEQVLDMNEFDWQKTIEVNTRRGFRIVMRDAPWEQYLRDHPNDTPPPVVAPPPNK